MQRKPFWLLLFLCLCFYACTGDDTSTTNNTGNTVTGPTGTIDVQFRLLQRAVPTNITTFRFTGLDAAGKYTYGPEVRSKTDQVTLTGVPTTTAILRIEYLENGVLRGIGDTPVTVPENGTVQVIDPDFQDVGQLVQRLEITPLSPDIPAGVALPFQATAVLFDGTTQDVTSSVTWTSSNTAVATVGNAPGNYGVAQALAAGSTIISASFADRTDSTDLTVTTATLQRVVVEPNNPVASAGTTQPFQAFGIFSDQSRQDITAQVTWTSATPAVASIQNPGGLARALTPGTSVITATEPTSGLADTTTLTVTAAVATRLALEPSSIVLPEGLSRQLRVVAQFADGHIQDVTSLATFSSSNTAAATVDATGLATAAAPGTAVLTARFSGLSATSNFETTSASVVSIAISPAPVNVPKGLTTQLEAAATLDNGQVVPVTDVAVWSSQNTAIAEVSNAIGTQGLLTALDFGQTTVFATFGGVQGQVQVTVSQAQLQFLDVEPAADTVPIGETSQLLAIGHFSDGTDRDVTTFVTWTSDDESIAFVNNCFPCNGEVDGEGLGTTNVHATDPVTGLTDFCVVTVTPAVLVSIDVIPDPADLFPTEVRRFRAVGTFSDGSTENLTRRVWWSSDAPLVVSISNFLRPGLAIGLIPGTAVIRAEHSSGLTGTADVTVSL